MCLFIINIITFDASFFSLGVLIVHHKNYETPTALKDFAYCLE